MPRKQSFKGGGGGLQAVQEQGVNANSRQAFSLVMVFVRMSFGVRYALVDNGPA